MPLTQEDRIKGYRSGLEKRKRRQSERRKKAHQMYHNEGLRKSEIARRLNVTPNTIRLDLLEPIDDTTE